MNHRSRFNKDNYKRNHFNSIILEKPPGPIRAYVNTVCADSRDLLN